MDLTIFRIEAAARAERTIAARPIQPHPKVSFCQCVSSCEKHRLEVTVAAVWLPGGVVGPSEVHPCAAHSMMINLRCLDNCSLGPIGNSVAFTSRFVGVVARCRRCAATGVTQMIVRGCPVTIIRGHSASVVHEPYLRSSFGVIAHW
ncbi:hypothetical protein B0H11DRAFT_1908283 [Mycena galericulata]|nr:hypothetical protein B0H11DRAFT_1908283 [Mycena galericulata]